MAVVQTERRQRDMTVVGSFTTHIHLAGRGAGKTYQGSEWLVRKAWENDNSNLVAIAPEFKYTLLDELMKATRRVTPDYVGGIEEADDLWPQYRPHKQQVQFLNGATITLFDSTRVDVEYSVRGHHYQFLLGEAFETWSRDLFITANMGLRLGDSQERYMAGLAENNPHLVDVLSGGPLKATITQQYLAPWGDILDKAPQSSV